MRRRFLFLTGLLGTAGVVAGALGSHALRGRLGPEALRAWETGVRFEIYHTLALGLTALLLDRRPSRLVAGAAYLFLSGTILFSGSLYVLALGGPHWLGPITPVGGLLLIGGWLALAVAGLRAPRS